MYSPGFCYTSGFLTKLTHQFYWEERLVQKKIYSKNELIINYTVKIRIVILHFHQFTQATKKLRFNEVADASSDLFGQHNNYLERRQLCPAMLCSKLGERRAALDYRSSALREPCRSWISLISSEWEVNAFLKCLSAAWAELQLCCSSLTAFPSSFGFILRLSNELEIREYVTSFHCI